MIAHVFRLKRPVSWGPCLAFFVVIADMINAWLFGSLHQLSAWPPSSSPAAASRFSPTDSLASAEKRCLMHAGYVRLKPRLREVWRPGGPGDSFQVQFFNHSLPQ